MKKSIVETRVLEVMFHDDVIPAYDDIGWDTLNQRKREDFALRQAKRAAIFAKLYVPFYRKHLSHLSLQDVETISTLEEFAVTIPPTTKQHLSHHDSCAFLPDFEWIHFHEMINKGTGGTTGQPVTVWYSQYDWRAMAQHISRSIKFDFRDSLDELRGRKILGLYHGDHVTNDIYRAGLKLLGVNLVGRVSTKKDVSQNYHFLEEIGPNGILAPPEDPTKQQTKGISLDAMLIHDAKNVRTGAFRLKHVLNPDFKMILWSSMPLSKAMYGYLKHHLGVPYIQGQYGSTESCPTAATCEYYPLDFHLGYGPNVVFVMHPSGKRLVKEQEEGFLLVTKTGGVYAKNQGQDSRIVPTGTNLVNYRTGDFAFLRHIEGKTCKCGRTTPILYNLCRKEGREIKAQYGCQID